MMPMREGDQKNVWRGSTSFSFRARIITHKPRGQCCGQVDATEARPMISMDKCEMTKNKALRWIVPGQALRFNPVCQKPADAEMNREQQTSACPAIASPELRAKKLEPDG